MDAFEKWCQKKFAVILPNLTDADKEIARAAWDACFEEHNIKALQDTIKGLIASVKALREKNRKSMMQK